MLWILYVELIWGRCFGFIPLLLNICTYAKEIGMGFDKINTTDVVILEWKKLLPYNSRFIQDDLDTDTASMLPVNFATYGPVVALQQVNPLWVTKLRFTGWGYAWGNSGSALPC